MDNLWVATRKGLFRFTAPSWEPAAPPAHLAAPVTAVLQDARDGTVYAALSHGHFGCKFAPVR